MTITITDAYTQRGWSQHDHLIDDSDIARMIGREYADLAEAMEEADERCDPRGFPALEYILDATGERWLRGGEPDLPGRRAMARRIDAAA